MAYAKTVICVLMCVPIFAHAKPIALSVCEVSRHPARYHGRNIQLRAMADSGMESALLFNAGGPQCGRINLNFDSAGNDLATRKFIELFNEQVEASCSESRSEELKHLLDSNHETPPPCVEVQCSWCPRYQIVAAFTGKLRYSGNEPGHAKFGHAGMFDLQLDVISVSNMDVIDRLGTVYDKKRYKAKKSNASNTNPD